MYEVAFLVEFSKVNGDENFIKEFNELNSHLSVQDYKIRAASLDFSKEEELLFELLCDIKSELFELKNANKNSLIPLKFSSQVAFVNYSKIWLKDAILESESEYYLRFEIKGKTVALFAKALSENELKFTQIKRSDEVLFDRFVADTQRSIICAKKEKNDD